MCATRFVKGNAVDELINSLLFIQVKMQTVILQEIRKFGEDTTIRGVPRIFKSTSRLVRIMWSLMVLASLAILLWQLSDTFQTYFRYPIESIYKEGSGRPTFPDVTVCNLYELAHANTFQLKWEVYLNLTSEKKRKFGNRALKTLLNISEVNSSYIWSMIQSPTGYYANFPYTELTSTTGKMIIDSQYFAWDWKVIQKVTRSAVHFELGHFDPNYGWCNKLVPRKASRSRIRGLSFIVYINNFHNAAYRSYRGFNSGLNHAYFTDPSNKEATGIRLSVHPPGTQANLDTGLNIGPGRKTTVHISNTIRTRLPIPHGNCTVRKHLEKEPVYPNAEETEKEGEAEKYTKSACVDICFQSRIVKKCGCVTSLFRFTRLQINLVNGTICVNQSLFTHSDIDNLEGFKRMACVFKTKSASYPCESQCADPCEELQYDVVVSSVPWPHVTSLMKFYTAYIRNKTNFHNDNFRFYEDLLAPNASDDEDFKRRLKRVLEDDFMQVDIVFDKLNPMELTETPSITTVKLLANAGGILSLWLGITVINAAEFVHFLVSLAIALHSRRRTTFTSSDDTETRKLKPTNVYSMEISDTVYM